MELWPKILSLFILPPGGIIVLAVLGLLLGIRWRVAGTLLLGTAALALIVFSLPLTAKQLSRGLEADYRPLLPHALPKEPPPAKAIVVLGGGRYPNAPEYAGDTVGPFSLERVRFAARLHRATGLPVLVSGGSVYREPLTEAELMARALKRDFGVPVRWLERRSRNTMENAVYTRVMLEREGIKHVYLVTHALHMRRALWAFTQAGLLATPAPTAYFNVGPGTLGLFGYLPSARGLQRSSLALHEHLGLLWYKIRYSPDRVAAIVQRAAAP